MAVVVPGALWVFDAVVSRANCRRVVDLLDSTASAPGGVLRHGRDVPDPRLRNCSEYLTDDTVTKPVVEAMQAVGTRVLRRSPTDRWGWDGPKFCRYGVGEFFRAHVDRSADPLDPAVVRARRLSLVCLLNDADGDGGLPTFDSGTLVVYAMQPDGSLAATNVRPPAGSVVAFRADLLHEVRPVRSGVRYSAVAWFHDLTGSEQP